MGKGLATAALKLSLVLATGCNIITTPDGSVHQGQQGPAVSGLPGNAEGYGFVDRSLSTIRNTAVDFVIRPPSFEQPIAKVEITENSRHGEISSLDVGNESAVYSPAPNYVGQDSFEYLITFTDGTRVAVRFAVSVTGGIGGQAYAAKVVGNLAFLAMGNGGLASYQLSNGSAPRETGMLRFSGSTGFGTAKDLDVQGAVAFVAMEEQGILSADISKPQKMNELWAIRDRAAIALRVLPGNKLAVWGKGESNLSYDLAIYDISNSAKPALSGAYRFTSLPFVNELPRLMANYGSFVFVGTPTEILSFNVGNPTSIQRPLRVSSNDPHGLLARDGKLYVYEVDGQIAVYAIDASGALARLNRFAATQNKLLFCHYDMEIVGDVLQVFTKGTKGTGASTSLDRGSLALWNIKDPFAPVLMGQIESPSNIQAQWGSLTVSVGTSIKVLNLTIPSHPVVLNSKAMINSLQQITVKGTLIAAIDYSGGLQSIDISNPLVPRVLGTSEPDGWGFRGLIQDDLAFEVSVDGKTKIFDVANPAAPQLRHAMDLGTPRSPVNGRYYDNKLSPFFKDGDLFAPVLTNLTGGFSAITFFDLADPSNPILGGSSDVEYALGPRSYSNKILATSDSSGHILNLRDLSMPRPSLGTVLYREMPDYKPATGQSVMRYPFLYWNSRAGLEIVRLSGVESAKIALLPQFEKVAMMKLKGSKLYLIYKDKYAAEIDVTDPSHPIVLKTIEVVPGIVNFDISADRLYTVGERGLDIFRF